MAYKPKLLTLAESGTGAALTASNGGILYSNASTAAVLAGTATAGQVLRSGSSTTPAWSTATYPATAGTSGNVLTSDGTNWSSSAPSSGTWSVISGNLTNAQVKALHGTPIQIIAAPGSGKVVQIGNFIGKLDYGGNNAFTAGAAQTIDIYYGTATTAGTIALLSNISITSTSDQTHLCNTTSITAAASTTYDNIAINLYNPVATEITGNAANDNLVYYNITYRIVTI